MEMPGRRPVSEAPLIDGFWMRLAALDRAPKAYATFAETYGFLRHEREEDVEDWTALASLLARLAEPWGPGSKEQDELPAPPPSLVLEYARHYHVPELGRLVLALDVIPTVDATGLGFRPVNLAGFIALQAIETVTASVLPSFHRCRWCRSWYVRGRSDQSFCIPPHRFLAHKHGDKETS
jgi:hypothetical protein